MRRFFLSLGFIGFLLSWAVHGEGPSPKVSVIAINDQIINPISAEYIEESIERAEEEGYAALVIQLDTPGGLLSSTRQIVKGILNAEVPVVVYVAPSGSRAGSAGVFITLASHVAAMAPSTNIGAAHPVEFGESPQKKDDSFRELIESLKKEKKVKGDEEKPEKNDQARRSVEGGTSPLVGEDVPKGQEGRMAPSPPLPRRGGGGDASPLEDKILNDTVAWISTIAEQRGRNVEWAVRAVKESISDGEAEALKLGVVDYVAEDLEELLEKIDGKEVVLASGKKVTLETRGAEVVRIEMTPRQRFLDVLINPNIAYILMMLGFYGLLFEITHPGSWFPGVAGLICIILAFYAFHTLPTNYAGIALIILSLALFAAEVFVTSYGLLSLVGIICLVLGSLFLIDSTAEFMRISLTVIVPIVAATAGIFLFLISLAVRAQRRVATTGIEGMVGQTGEMQGPGKVLVAGEIWDAVASAPLTKGDRVRVLKVEGMTVSVEKI